MADRYEVARKALDARLLEAQMHRGSDAYAAFCHLIEALDTLYGEELRTADEERTPIVRGASLQCRALFDTLIDRDGYQSPKI